MSVPLLSAPPERSQHYTGKVHQSFCRHSTTPGALGLRPMKTFIEERDAQDPDITLHELLDALVLAEGERVYYSIAVTLQRLSFS